MFRSRTGNFQPQAAAQIWDARIAVFPVWEKSAGTFGLVVCLYWV